VSYTDEFYELETRVARESAEVVIPWLLERLSVERVIDVGCGTGAWAAVAQKHGCDVFGVDGHVPDLALLLEPYEFERVDLSANIYMCDSYDLAICLEVAEHLPEEAASYLVDGLCGAKAVLFSAATPGQPGEGHINCQPHTYWHALFAEHGFQPERVGELFGEPVADFYRRNMYLYQ
jgi:SAM-dependent methyltransferase